MNHCRKQIQVVKNTHCESVYNNIRDSGEKMEALCDSGEKMEELVNQVEKELQLQQQHHGKNLIDTILSGETPIQLLGQSYDELPPFNNAKEDNTDDKLYNKFVLWTSLLGLQNILEKQKHMKRKGTDEENKENVLPISIKDLASLEKSPNWKAFLRFTRSSVINIPPEQHGALLLLCGSFLGYQVKNLSTPFDNYQHGKSSHYSLLSFDEAFPMFLPEIAHVTMFILCYFLTMILVWPLQLGVQFFLMFLLISTPLYYFPELARKASGVDVDCGSFKLPLIWYATLGALGFSLICGLITLLMVYFSWRHINEKGPRMLKEVKVGLDDFAGVLDG